MAPLTRNRLIGLALTLFGAAATSLDYLSAHLKGSYKPYMSVFAPFIAVMGILLIAFPATLDISTDPNGKKRLTFNKPYIGTILFLALGLLLGFVNLSIVSGWIFRFF
jgi:hypothetical protein